jgi:hypothetical protein
MSVKVLVVIDGSFRFDASAAPAGDVDFTYSTLISALTGAGFDVTKANRTADSSATPGFDSFHFDALPLGRSLLEFDVIWMIGFAGRNISGSSAVGGLGPSQLNAIAAYMEAGGGVFATGDHDSLGADMCGHIPRVRVMRCWYGAGDSASPFGSPLPAELTNFSRDDGGRADTVHKKATGETPASQYPSFGDGHDDYTWFENQSDHFPQTITPTPAGPAHPILRNNGHDITVYPDHMHEGNTLGEVGAATYNYATVMSPYGDTGKPEFRDIVGLREKPKVIATGQALAHASRSAASASSPPTLLATEGVAKSVNTLSVYDGRQAGVGRIVTGSTFHHYIDINLIGATGVTNSPTATTRVGSDALQGHGYNDNAAVLDDIKAVYVNITNWLARPRPTITLILERSTFSQDEVAASPNFEGAVLVTVDGLKPSQFPGGGINALGDNPPGLSNWAPAITAAGGVPIQFEPTRVDSDDPTHPDRIQRFTFTYRVHFTGPAFGFSGNASPVQVTATLPATGIAAPLTDMAWLQLVKSANPFMLDVADGNTTSWLSSDVKVFHVVEGQTFHGVLLPMGATRDQALTFIHTVASSIDSATFGSLPPSEEGSVLSSLPTTTGSPALKVYNFALARVRLSNAGSDADPVRVFFRIFTTQTTAALTYHLDTGSMPVEGYLRTAGANPIALPGTQNGGSDWLSFPCFAHTRTDPPSSQVDPDNAQPVKAATGFRIFGALVDNNLTDPYLPLTPGSAGPKVPLPTLMMGEHQCIVAQIEFSGAPIPNGATPWTSDKISQRNLALSAVANPGLDGSRVAVHTFEIEATPQAISDALPPDELLLEWSDDTPAGTMLRIHIPSWTAEDVIEIADRFYPRHEIAVVDAHTIELPSGGTRYVPIPKSFVRQTGVIAAEFPLGIRKGQRFDVSVRHITNKSRQAKVPRPRVQEIPRAEAEKLLAGVTHPQVAGVKGAFTLGENKVLITDLTLLDAIGDHAVVIEHPAPAAIAAAVGEAGQWRETIGAFQLGVPVSTKGEMLLHQMRLLSVMRWRTAQLSRNSRWYATMVHYVGLLAEKVQALGGNAWAVPATPDGVIPQLADGDGGSQAPSGGDTGASDVGDPRDPFFEPAGDDWLGGTGGLDAPDKARAGIWSGKVSGLLFDHFGDFEGFTLEAYDGMHRRFFSRESAIRDLAKTAWLERYVVTVITVSTQSRRVRRLLIRGYAD